MTKTVLIVDDNELNVKLFNDLLEASGYGTVTTQDGHQAVALAREHAPDLILMDVQLPGISGLDITRTMKSDDGLKQIPVIAVTAHASKEDEERIRQSGCDDYVSKPIDIAMFLETVSRYLG